MQQTENVNLQEGKPTTAEIVTTKKTEARPITMRLQRLTQPMNEYEVIQVEDYCARQETLRRGVSDSMNTIDSSATVLLSQMTSLLKTDDPEVRKPGEWATSLAIQCGKGISELIKAKTEAMRLLR